MFKLFNRQSDTTDPVRQFEPDDIKTPRQTIMRRVNTFASKLTQESTADITRIFGVVVIIFMIIFVIWFAVQPDSFSNSNPDEQPTIAKNAFNGLYFWIVTTSTTGYGDICPKTIASKSVTMIYQSVITLASVGLLWRITDDNIRNIGS